MYGGLGLCPSGVQGQSFFVRWVWGPNVPEAGAYFTGNVRVLHTYITLFGVVFIIVIIDARPIGWHSL